MKSILLTISLLLTLQAFPQHFLKRTQTDPMEFKEMQKQFYTWSKTHDLKKEKLWKYYKRWEADMQLHTDAKGEPGDPAIFIGEAIKAAEEKQSFLQKTTANPWYPVGPNVLPTNNTGYMENGIGRVNCISFDPANASVYYVGVAQGGLWKTTNNGQSWIPLTDQLPITRISDICIDPNNTNTIYISVCDFEYIGFGLKLNGRKRNTHYGLGVYKTTDGGLNWQATGLSFQLTNGDASLIRKILVHPNNSNKLVACGVSGMYTSNDAGQSWTKTIDSLFWDLIPDPTNPSVLYAAGGWVYTANTGYAAIYKSNDFGATWTMLNTGIPGTGSVQRLRIALAPSDHTRIYALAVNTEGGLYGIYKSGDAGQNWQFIIPNPNNILEWNDGTGIGGQGTYDLGLLIDQQNKDLVYVGGVNMWGSTDGGQNFNPVGHWTLNYGPTIHGDIHFIDRQPLTGNIFVCSDGGIYRTSGVILGSWNDANNGIPWPTQWTRLNDGIQVSSFYRISSSKNNADRLIAGAQDNGSFYYDGSAWTTVFGGDGMDNYLDPQNDNILIGSSQYGNFEMSTDGGMNGGALFVNVNNEPAEWTSPLIADYNNYGTLYAGFANVCKSTDNGSSWSSISSFTQNPNAMVNNEISAIAVSNSNPQVLYVTRRVRYEQLTPGSVYKTINGGNNWTNITAGLPDSLYYTSVEISEHDPKLAWVSMAGFSTGNKVFKTTNGGQSWQNISYNLPNIPVNCVKYIPGTNDIMIATDLGVYTHTSGSSTWINKSQGLPNVIVSDIEFNPATNKIYLSTFGRGVWGTDLDAFISVKNSSVKASSVKLFPTVNNGTFTLQFNRVDNDELNMEIIDVSGRVINSMKLKPQYSEQMQFNLRSGIYYAHIKGKKLNEVKSFIVQ